MSIQTSTITGLLHRVSSTDRLEVGNFDIHEIGSVDGKGLDILTRAIFNSVSEIAKAETLVATFKAYTGRELYLSNLNTRERNHRLAALVRNVWASHGWLQGYMVLIEAAPDAGLHPRIVDDVRLASLVYTRLSAGYRRRDRIDVKMTIGPKPFYDSIDRVGPKSGGGSYWKASKEYSACLQRPEWRNLGFCKGLSPCALYAWVGSLVKSVPRKYIAIATKLQLLGVVDYDLDELEENKGGFQSSLRTAAQSACAPGSPLQGPALASLINYDFQVWVRGIHQSWVAKNEGPFNLGPEENPAEEWIAMMVGDCAALAPWGFESAETYDFSRTGIIAAMQTNCFDVVFDTGCSNRINSSQYAEAAGVAQYGIHAAFCIGFYEACGKLFLDTLIHSGDAAKAYYGPTTHVTIGPWCAFNTRYRAWERCVKYSRQLVGSSAAEAEALLKLSHSDLVLKDCDLEIDAGKSWARAVRSSPQDLVKRKTERYFIPPLASELFQTPGVQLPVLCGDCGPNFHTIMASNELDEVHAIGGLPETVTSCRAAGLAVGIRRAVLWAINSSQCCEKCACSIGFWADAVSYTVLSALLHDEPHTGSATWPLQNYLVGAVTFWPIALPFLLSGFDLVAHITCEDGAMGKRDVVDI
ncbi:hypothetical protein MMC31_004034 [Peltigera leucophlebia]|nr:hypothetical protein [Peltigera leucophlebia]